MVACRRRSDELMVEGLAHDREGGWHVVCAGRGREREWWNFARRRMLADAGACKERKRDRVCSRTERAVLLCWRMQKGKERQQILLFFSFSFVLSVVIG